MESNEKSRSREQQQRQTGQGESRLEEKTETDASSHGQEKESWDDNGTSRKKPINPKHRLSQARYRSSSLQAMREISRNAEDERAGVPLPASGNCYTDAGFVLRMLETHLARKDWRAAQATIAAAKKASENYAATLGVSTGVLEMSISQLPISLVTCNYLEAEDIHTVEDLLNRKKKELLSISYFGEKRLKEVLNAVADLGVELQK